MMKRWITLAAVLLLAGCEGMPTVAEVFTLEVCNDMFEVTLGQIDEQKETIAKMRKFIETAERTGKQADADAQRETLESHRKEGIGGNIKYIEEQLIKNCDTSKFNPGLMDRLAEAKKLLDEKDETFTEEGMPDLRVTSIGSTFIPYQMDSFGRCEGPFLDLVFTITNVGGDYPRPVDVQTLSERAKRPADEMPFFTLIGELDFGGDMKKRVDIEIKGASGGYIKSGGSKQIPAKIRIDYNQIHAKVKGTVATTAFLKTATDTAGTAHETEVDVPLWDIYIFSHQAVGAKDEDGKYYIGTKGTVTNLGKSPTPGPIEASFTIFEAKTNRYITGWSGKTDGQVSGNTDIYAKTYSATALPKQIFVESTIIPLCPDGKPGNLADGDTKNNIRRLLEAGATGSGTTTGQSSSAGG
jgi:hypothetical protein